VIVRFGFFYRTSDSRRVQRFLCRACRRTSSYATVNAWFRQKKRNKNFEIKRRLCSGESIRRIAFNLHVNRKTVARKLLSLGFEAEQLFHEANHRHPPSRVIEFDDLETFEHTKCKPLSITLAVQKRTRRILGL
jgi:transposase-like protein